MASVAMDLALNAVSAVPVAGWIIGIVVGIGRALASIFKGQRTGIPPPQRARLPWGKYNRDIDQEWVRTFINIDAAGVDWTPLFAPPTEAVPWQLADGVDAEDPKNILGKVFAPFANKTVQYNGGYGCLPGTFRVAGLVQYRNWNQPPNSELRFYSSGEIVQQHGEFTQTGDFFPALQQLAGTTWQQIAAGGPDAYKVDCVKLERLWKDWFSALYESAMEQGYGDYLLPYLARKVHGEWRLGANASGIYRPTAPNGKYVPLVTAGTFKDGVLATPKTRAGCWFTDGLKDGKRYAFETAQKWPYDEKTGAFQAPPASKYGSRSDYACVAWPPAELLLSQYKRADEVITTPAARASPSSSAAVSRAAWIAPTCGPSPRTAARRTPHSPTTATSAITASKCASASSNTPTEWRSSTRPCARSTRNTPSCSAKRVFRPRLLNARPPRLARSWVPTRSRWTRRTRRPTRRGRCKEDCRSTPAATTSQAGAGSAPCSSGAPRSPRRSVLRSASSVGALRERNSRDIVGARSDAGELDDSEQ
jgi:hypothetical protein